MMIDQASVLRSWVRQRAVASNTSGESGVAEASTLSAPRSILICSGKGGVGKSSLTLNLGLTLAGQGQRVGLIDASSGLSHLDLLSGLNASHTLEHVLTGSKRLADAQLKPAENVFLLTGLSAACDSGERMPTQQARLADELDHYFSRLDYLLIDAAAGNADLNRRLIKTVDRVLLVTTLESTALADTYSLLKTYSGRDLASGMELLINRSEVAPAQAGYASLKQTMTMFLHQNIPLVATIPEDLCVPAAVMSRRPFVLRHPEAPASLALAQLTARLVTSSRRRPQPRPFFQRFFN